MKESVYFRLGILASMSLVHGGACFRVLSPTVFRVLSGKNPADLIASIDEVPELNVRDILHQVGIFMYTYVILQRYILSY